MRIDEKIEKFLNEYGEESEYHLRNKNPGSLVGTGLKRNPNPMVELTDDNYNQEDVSRAWPYKIAYEGRPIFDAYMNIVDKIDANLRKQYNFEGQECYLGYNPNNESFITASEGVIDGEDGDEDVSVISFMNFDSGQFKVFRTEQRASFFYGSGYSPYKYIHREYPGTLDLRLD